MPASGRPFLVGTAGHIDHGKTTLVKRLTGVDTDRLPEEKRRGITIVLGFAPLALPSGRRVGLIDVPGHERFVKNMVAGAGGFDLLLLVIAADEGVMPQTREHLEIAQLLHVGKAVVALTKIDRATPELLQLAEDDVRAALAGTSMAAAPIVPVSAQTGAGIDRLLATIDEALDTLAAVPEGPTYLPIDRTFVVKGFGSVVTGSLLGGTIAVGDELEILPSLVGHELSRPAKVRGLQIFGAAVETASAGQRVAVNLQGVELESLAIGQCLVTPGAARPTRRLTVSVEHLAARATALPTGARAQLLLGTAQVDARVSLLDRDELEPGARGFATLRLAAPVAALPGRRYILRTFRADAGAGRTLAGGTILDPEPPRRRRLQAPTLEILLALDRWHTGHDDLGAVLAALAKERGEAGAAIPDLARRLGASPEEIRRTTDRARGALVRAADRAVDEAALEGLGERIVAALGEFHAAYPFRAVMPTAELTSRLGRHGGALAEVVARRLVNAGRAVAERDGYRLSSHRPKLELDPEARARVLAALGDGLEPLTGRELLAASGLPDKALREVLAALVRAGEVIHVGEGLHFSRAAWDRAREAVTSYARANDGITTQQAKALLEISRKYLIPLLESFDRQGVTVRQGEIRRAKSAGA